MEGIQTITAEAVRRCPTCGMATEMRVEWPRVKMGRQVGTQVRNVAAVCACQQSAIDSEEIRWQREKAAHMERQRYERAFGDRVCQGSFEGDDGRNADLMDACSAYVEMFDAMRAQKVNGLLLHGPTRTGKTFAAEAIAAKLHESGRSVLMDTAAGFVQRLQTASSTEREALMRRVARCDLLVLDDFGASRDTSFGREAVFSIIDARVSAGGPMVVTTNLSAVDLAGAESVDDKRAAYRIMERCLQIEVDPSTDFTANADHRAAKSIIFKK